MIHSWTKPRHFTQGLPPLCLRCFLRVKSEKMDIEKEVSVAAKKGVDAILDLADKYSPEASHVVYDILDRNHPAMYKKVKEWFEE
jgi:hypothetical protein